MGPKRIPRAEEFISFNSPDLAQDGCASSCIYWLVDKNRRCSSSISPPDRVRAQMLRSKILRNPADSFDDLREYAIANSCKRWHRSKIEDYGLAEALARRWQAELLETVHASVSDVNSFVDSQANDQAATSSSNPPLSTNNMEQSMRYNLRSRTNTQQSFHTAVTRQSHDDSNLRFRPHLHCPHDNVVSKLRLPVGKRDGKSGILYIFERASSPGHVKIGVTSTSIRSRFSQISQKCHYMPELLHSFADVPHVYRVETLVHFELGSNWRVERRCEGCSAQHKEWFEIDAHCAIEVAGHWVLWMKEAVPYDRDGMLTMTWRDHVRQLQAEGRPVTGRALLEIHRASQYSSTMSQPTVTEATAPLIESESSVINVAYIAAVVHIVLAYMEQVRVQQILEQNFRQLRHPSSLGSRSPTVAFTRGELLRRDTSMSIASQA